MNRVAFGFVLISVAGGCVTTTPIGPADHAAWAEHSASISSLSEWRLEGRAGLTVDQDGYNGTLSWEQLYEDIDFRVRGPFGIGGMRIHGGPEQLRVKTSQGEVFFLEDPVPDMEKQLGWSIPLRSMPFWLRGLPDPKTAGVEQIDENGLLRRLEQEGWRITYDQYREVEGIDLPRKMTLQGDRVRIKLIVDNWNLPGAGSDPDYLPDL